MGRQKLQREYDQLRQLGVEKFEEMVRGGHYCYSTTTNHKRYVVDLIALLKHLETGKKFEGTKVVRIPYLVERIGGSEKPIDFTVDILGAHGTKEFDNFLRKIIGESPGKFISLKRFLLHQVKSSLVSKT